MQSGTQRPDHTRSTGSTPRGIMRTLTNGTNALLIIATLAALTTAGIITFILKVPLPDWYSNSAFEEKADNPTIHKHRIRVGVVPGEVHDFSQQLLDYLKNQPAETDYRHAVLRRVMKITTQDKELASKILALHTPRGKLTHQYSKWTGQEPAQQSTLPDGQHQIHMVIRGIHHRPDLIRIALAFAITTAFLLVAATVQVARNYIADG